MKTIYEETEHVVGKPIHLGGSGDPSVVTAYGVLMGMKGSAYFKWGKDSLSGKKILVQGIGNVGRNLIELFAFLTGWLLGGLVGYVTILFVIGIGPVVQIVLPYVDMRKND